jgi:carbonic anhydrase/acetyltransferase-like protein (isoleucine patch superfamily)
MQEGVETEEMKPSMLVDILARVIGLVIVGALVAFAHLLDWRNSYQGL